MPLGFLTLDDGEVMDISYALQESTRGGFIHISGSVANFDFAMAHRLFGMTVTLTLSDGRRLRIIFDRPSQFVGTGGYF